jgi:hypothetical protein
VEEGGRVRHRGEPDGGNAHLAQVPEGGIRHFIPFPLGSSVLWSSGWLFRLLLWKSSGSRIRV